MLGQSATLYPVSTVPQSSGRALAALLILTAPAFVREVLKEKKVLLMGMG